MAKSLVLVSEAHKMKSIIRAEVVEDFNLITNCLFLCLEAKIAYISHLTFVYTRFMT